MTTALSEQPSLNPPDAPAPLPETFEQRTLVLGKPSEDLRAACLALTLQAKNLYNTGIFAIRNVTTAYERVDAADQAAGWKLKPVLHEHQRTAIERFNVAISSVNASREAKYKALQALAKESPENTETVKKAAAAKLKLVPLLGDTVANVSRPVLDITILDNVMRAWPNQAGVAVYARMPAKASQLVLHRLRDGYSGFFEALKRFTAGGSAMTGWPKPPNYRAKKSHFVLELPLTQIGERLIGLGKRSIPVDFEESVSLTEAQLDAWNDYRIGEAVALACKRRGFSDQSVPQHLRIVPHGGTVKLEVVVRVPSVVPENSLLGRLTQTLGATLAEAGSKRNEVLVASIRDDLTLRAMGVDFGVNNTAALAFNTGHRAIVVGAGRLEHHLNKFDGQLEALQSQLTTSDLRELQGRKTALQALEPPQKLPRADEMALRKGLKAIYADTAYLTVRQARERWLSDYLHKLSRGIVDACCERQIDVLVLGKNTGWKDGMNLGRVQNRRFGNVPIARLIEQIRYKAESLGMVVVTTEESYTSKTSFVNHEELKTHSKESRKTKKSKDVPAALSAAESTLPCGKAALTPVGATAPTLPSPGVHTPLGKRLKDDRNTFINTHQTGRWARVHADVNGAFNMLRKVFKEFKCHAALTLKYTLMRVSPRLGLAAIGNLG